MRERELKMLGNNIANLAAEVFFPVGARQTWGLFLRLVTCEVGSYTFNLYLTLAHQTIVLWATIQILLRIP